MFFLKLGILACIGALIGWITNILAIKLLFRPMNPVKLPFGLIIQGVLPRRKEEIAKSIGEIIEQELVSTSEILDGLLEADDIEGIKKQLSERLQKLAKEKLPSFLLGVAGGSINSMIDKMLEAEGEEMIRAFIHQAIHKANERINLAEMVEEKINAYDFMQFEHMIMGLVKKELRHIELLGAVLGFLIGLMQGVVLLMFN